MTKSEVLQLDEPSAIWNEMQKNPALRTEGDVWLHMTRLSAKQDRQRSQEAYLYIQQLEHKGETCYNAVNRKC